MEKEYQISWLKVIIGIICFIVIIGVLYLIIPNKSKGNIIASSTYITNINLMKEAGFDYFRGSNLPEKIGETNEITLKEMINSNLLIEFYDDNGKSCDTENSYIKVTKNIENEYDMKVFLNCGGKQDYIVTSIYNNSYAYNNSGTSSNGASTTINNNNSNNTTNNSYVVNNSSNTSNTSSNNSSSNKPSNNNSNINYCNGNDCLSNVYYTVTFDTANGTYVPKQIVKYGNRIASVTTYRDGYTFLGWYNNNLPFDVNTPITTTTHLVAKWQKNNNNTKPDNKTYIVTFMSNGGTAITPITVPINNKISKPTNPTKNCYDFMGWYTDSSFTKKYDFNTPVTSDLVLFAKWSKNNTCKITHNVTYVYNNGENARTITIDDGSYIYQPTNPTRTCYDFLGWYSNNSLTTRYDFNTPVTRDLVLYAKWQENNTCKTTHNVTYIYNNGSSSRTITVNDGDYLTQPSTPTRNGYRFVGWYSNNTVFNFNRRIYSDYIIEAVWEKETLKYNTYCKKEEKRYYSTSYVSANENTWNYNWTIKFDQLKNVQNVRVSNIGYLTNLSMYNDSYNNSVRGKEISQVNGNPNYGVRITSGSMLRTYSLKSNNFDKSLSSPYYYQGYWYINAYVSIRNYYSLTKYYAPNIKSEIYFVPFYFDISYTDINNCVVDLASASSYYKNYEIIETFYN